MRTSGLLVALVFTFVATASPVGAQNSHSAPQSAIDAALQQKVSAGQADREAVQRLLDRPEVAAVAGDAGLDLRRAKDAVSTMSAQDVAALAVQASQVEQSLAGGQSRITINTTLLIIGLLVLILLILALK
jgi:hypothetical protein